MPPILAFAEQEAVAEQGAQHADRGGSTAVVRRVVDEDVVDARGPAENDLPPAEEIADQYLFLEGLRRESQQRILAQARAMPRAEAPSCGARGAGGKIARPSLTARIRTSPQPPSQRSASPRFIQASIHGLVGTGGRRDQVCCLFGRRCQSVDLTEWCRCVCQPSRVTPGSPGRSPSSCCCRSGPAGGMPNPRATSCRWPDAKCLLGCRHCR